MGKTAAFIRRVNLTPLHSHVCRISFCLSSFKHTDFIIVQVLVLKNKNDAALLLRELNIRLKQIYGQKLWLHKQRKEAPCQYKPSEQNKHNKRKVNAQLQTVQQWVK